MVKQTDAARRVPLSRDRVLRAAVALADEAGIDELSMRRLAHELDVVAMALYRHVANKEQLLDGMVDVVFGEIEPPVNGADWKASVRHRILSARGVLLVHPWASRVVETRTAPTPAVLEYLDSIIGMFRAGGFSVDLTHHVLHALGNRVWGFTQALFGTTAPVGTADPETQAAAARALSARYPHVSDIAIAATHEGESVVGSGCDDQFRIRVRARHSPRRIREASGARVDLRRPRACIEALGPA